MRVGRTIAFLLILAATTASFDRAFAQEIMSPAEALGIKRVHVPAATKIDDLIKTEGTLVEIPLAALDARLERLVKLQIAAKQPPRLVKSIYKAELASNHLTNGSGQWVIEHTGAVPSIFPLPAFNLALRQPPRLEGREAILGDLGGGNLGLWIEKSGLQSFDFDWSLRGTPGVQGVSFDLRVPPCPLMSIELKLPADRTLAAPRTSGLLTGPHETENPSFKIWRLQVTGRSQVEFTVRRGIDAGRTARIFASNGTSVQFSPEQTLYDADAQIEVLHAPVTELVFEVDPRLQAYEVSSRQIILSNWHVEPAPAGAKPGNNRSLLRIQLREPLLGVLNGLRLRFHGPRWTDQEAVLPHIELRGAISRNETLKLHLHPDQHLERWDSGSFRLVYSATESDGSQSMTLADAQPDGKGPRPRFLVRTGGVDFTVNQDTRWRIDPAGMSLTSEIQYDVSRGQLFAFDVRLPGNAAWRVQVDLKPREALQKWSVAGGVLHVDLQRGITPRSDCKLTVTLEDERDKSLARPNTIAIPDLKPLGAKLRQGTLAILADAHQHISLEQSNVPTTRPDSMLVKDPRLQFFFAFRQTPVQGTIKLAPQQAVLQARTQQQVMMTPESTRIIANVTIEPMVGQPRFVDLFFANSGRQPWKIEAKGAEIARKERLPVSEIARLGLRLGATNPLSRLIGNMLYPRGPIWRIHFREPLTKAVELVAQHEIPAPGGNGLAGAPPPLLAIDHGVGLVASSLLTRLEREWRIPIVVPLDAERVEGEVLLQPLGAAITGVQSRGLDTAALAGAPSKTFTRLFRFKNAGLLDAPTLRVKANRRLGDDTAQAILDVAELTTSVDAAGNVFHHLRASVWNWRALDFRVVLPSQATLVAARLNQIDLDRLPRRARDEGLEVLIPMSQGPGPQTVELIYRSEPNSWFGPLGCVVAAPLPKLPLRPLMVERALQLGPDWLPLRQEQMVSLDRRAPAQEAIRGVWRAGESWNEEFLPSGEFAWIERQRLALLGADGALRRAGPREMSLAEAFSKLLDDTKLDNAVLVLDRVAMRGLGLSPKSSVALTADGLRPFWENLGLVYVPTPQAALLTSKGRAVLWARSIREGNETGALVSAAVAAGFAFGQDSSGQFCAIDYWLRTEGPAGYASPRPLQSAATPDGTTLWRPIFGLSSDDSFVVVRGARVRAMAALMALAAAGVGLALRRVLAVPVFFRCAWLALTGCVLGLVAAPLSVRELALAPLVIVAVMLVDCYRRILWRLIPEPAANRPSRSTPKVAKASLAGILFATLSFWGLCRAQEPEAKVIFVIGAETGQNQRAFVRPELLRWLDGQEKQWQPTLSDAVFLSVRYRGNWGPDAVMLHADYDLCTFKDQGTLVVPLAGVDLMEGSSLDGEPILPVVAPGGKMGYQIVVPTKGRHRLSLSFQSRPLASGELKFSGPMAPCSSLQLTCPSKLGLPRLVRGLGEDTLRRDVNQGEQVLEAQLGHEPTIQIQGLAAAATNPVVAPKVREFYFWDLRLRNHSAQGLLAYRTTHEVERLEMQIPSGLEVRSVDLAEAIPGQPAGAIKAWRLVPRDGGKVLQIDLLQPVTGSFQVLLGMAPRWPKAAGHFELRMPMPLQAELIDGMMGVRVDASDATAKGQFLSLAAEAPEAFVKEWATLDQRGVGPPLHAFAFIRATKNAAAAAFEVTPSAEKPRVQSEVIWTAMPQTVDLEARLNVAAGSAADDFFMLPINLSPSVVLRNVQGADVHHWSRQGDKLHVWLVGPRKKSSVTLVGWVPHSHPKTMSVMLPAPTVIGATIDAATLTLASASGLVLEPKTRLVEEPPAEPGQRRFRSATGRFPAEFQLRTRAAPAEYDVLTVAEMHGASCTLAAHVHGRIGYGYFPDLQIRLSNWPASAPRLSLAVAEAIVQPVPAGPDHGWIIKIPSHAPQQISFSIKGQLPLKPGQTLKLPELHIERGGRLGEQIVALAGMQFSGPLKTSTVGAAATKDLFSWPLEHARLRSAGAQYVKRPAVGPLPAVQPRETVAEAPATILTARHQVLAGQQSQWLYRMSWSLWTKSGHDLEIELPRGAAFAAAFIDDQPATPRQTGPKTLSLPIPPSLKPHTVGVCWTIATPMEKLGQPSLAPARLLGLEPVTVVGELLMPPGWRITERSWGTAEHLILLSEIQAEARALQILGDELASAGKAGQGPLVQSLQTFAALVDRAQYRLRFAPESEPRVRDSLDVKLKALIDDESKRAKSFGLEAVRLAAEKSPWLAAPQPSFPGADSGAPIGWLQAPDSQVPRVVLRPSADVPPRLSLLPLAIVVFVLSFWPLGLVTWIRLWPEQLATIAGLGVALGGLSLVGVGLLLIAIAGRALSIVRLARRYLAASRP